MTKIPTISEMEELLLRDSKTEDLVEAGNKKSRRETGKDTLFFLAALALLNALGQALASCSSRIESTA